MFLKQIFARDAKLQGQICWLDAGTNFSMDEYEVSSCL